MYYKIYYTNWVVGGLGCSVELVLLMYGSKAKLEN